MESDLYVRGMRIATMGSKETIPVSELSGLYLVLRALDGDMLAQEILNAAGTVVLDAGGKQIYPPKEND